MEDGTPGKALSQKRRCRGPHLAPPGQFEFDKGGAKSGNGRVRAVEYRAGAENGQRMDDGPAYLVRYGLMGHVGRFALDPDGDEVPRRGQSVVIRTDRGLELGEVLTHLAAPPPRTPAKETSGGRGEEQAPAQS